MADAKPPDRPPDAIRCPPGLPVPRPGEDQLAAIKRLFAPVFQCTRVYSRTVSGGAYRLITPVTDDVAAADHPAFYASTHPRAGQERHDWFPQGQTGIDYGWLRPEPAPDGEPPAHA